MLISLFTHEGNGTRGEENWKILRRTKKGGTIINRDYVKEGK